MLAFDDDTRAVLRNTHTGSVRAVARYQGLSTDVELAREGSVSFRGDGRIQSSSSGVTAYGVGNSLVPHSKDAPLATYGQELAVWRTVKVRSFLAEIPLGVFRITEAGNAFERFRGDTVLDWSVELTLQDRFEPIIAADFLSVDSPKSGNTAWAEIRRLSPFPVQESLTDVSVPPATVYESRFEAIVTLARLMGGVPHLTREGVLTVRRADRWVTDTVPDFEISGTISYSGQMSNDFFNQVRVSNPNDASVVAYATITDDSNPLSVSRAGARTYTQSSSIYTTKQSALAAATTILKRVSTQRSRTVNVACTPEALILELGDFGWFRDTVQRRNVLGEVSQITVSLDPIDPVRVEVIVAEES